MPPGDICLLTPQLGQFLLLLLALPLQQLGLQHSHGEGAILVLGALILTRDDDPGGQMGDAHRRIGLVYVLAPCARRPEGLDLEVFWGDLDVVSLFHFRYHVHGGEGGVAAAGGVEGGDAHQPVHPLLSLQSPVDAVARDAGGDAAASRFLSGGAVYHLPCVAVLLGPAQVHAGQHVHPVAGLGAPGSGVDVDDGVVCIIRPGEELGQLLLRQPPRGLGQRGLDLRRLGLGVLFFGQLGEGGEILGLTQELLKRLQLPLAPGDLGEQALRALAVLPEVRRGGALLELSQLSFPLGEVKDDPSIPAPD